MTVAEGIQAIFDEIEAQQQRPENRVLVIPLDAKTALRIAQARDRRPRRLREAHRRAMAHLAYEQGHGMRGGPAERKLRRRIPSFQSAEIAEALVEEHLRNQPQVFPYSMFGEYHEEAHDFSGVEAVRGLGLRRRQ